MIARLGIDLALAARLGAADRRHMRIVVGLLARAATRLAGVLLFGAMPRFGGLACFRRMLCFRSVPWLATRFARLVAALAIAATALWLAASAASVHDRDRATRADDRFARLRRH